MLTIYKYSIQVDDEVLLHLPAGARILSVQKQGMSPIGRLEIWALVDPDASPEVRRLLVRGTGHDATDVVRCSFLGTVQEMGGSLVWHVFEDEFFPVENEVREEREQVEVGR